MKISTKGRYALRLMLDLAQHQGEGVVALKDVALRQGISKKYLEQIIPSLVNANFLKTLRGNKGGYMLAREPAQYSVGDILRVTEGSLCPVSCVEETPLVCARSEFCPTRKVWKGLSGVIAEYLDGISLESLMQKEETLAGQL